MQDISRDKVKSRLRTLESDWIKKFKSNFPEIKGIGFYPWYRDEVGMNQGFKDYIKGCNDLAGMYYGDDPLSKWIGIDKSSLILTKDMNEFRIPVKNKKWWGGGLPVYMYFESKNLNKNDWGIPGHPRRWIYIPEYDDVTVPILNETELKQLDWDDYELGEIRFRHKLSDKELKVKLINGNLCGSIINIINEYLDDAEY